MRSPCLLVLALVATTACGSVEIPDQHFYRLEDPAPSGGFGGRAGVVRVESPELATHLAGDRLLVADGPVEVRSYAFHHWAGSLDGLVADALRTGLERSRAFAGVMGPGDPGSAALVLSGRVVELCQVPAGERWVARAVLRLHLVDTERGRVVFDDEFRSDVPLPDAAPAALVQGLSRGLGEIVDRVLARAQQAGLFDRATASEPPR